MADEPTIHDLKKQISELRQARAAASDPGEKTRARRRARKLKRLTRRLSRKARAEAEAAAAKPPPEAASGDAEASGAVP